MSVSFDAIYFRFLTLRTVWLIISLIRLKSKIRLIRFLLMGNLRRSKDGRISFFTKSVSNEKNQFVFMPRFYWCIKKSCLYTFPVHQHLANKKHLFRSIISTKGELHVKKIAETIGDTFNQIWASTLPIGFGSKIKVGL